METTQAEIRELYHRAAAALKAAYAPYSGFSVGCALRTDSGNVYVGCNIENASLGATICAERSAIATAISAGDRKITDVLVITAATRPIAPCGICRQVLFEFGTDIVIYSGTVASGPDKLRRYTIAELLPAPPNDSIEWEKGRFE